jgi:hypothetical protein
MHRLNCCGSQQAIGINHAQRDAFDVAETAWDSTCGACACPATLPQADDGMLCAQMSIRVTCDNGMCTTHCN